MRTEFKVVEPLTYSGLAAFRLLGISKQKGFALIRDGRLQARVLDGRYRITRTAIDNFLASLPPAETDAA